MKKLNLMVALLLVGLFSLGLLASCGGDKDTTTSSSGGGGSAGGLSSSSSGGSGESEGKVSIRLLTRLAGQTPSVKIFHDVLDEFDDEYPELTIIDESQGDESAFNNKLMTDISAGTMPNIFRIHGVANLGQYIDNGLLMDIEPLLKEDPEWGDGFTPGALDYYRVAGYDGIYGIPAESGLIGFFYNEAILHEVGLTGPPETYNDLKEAIVVLRNKGYTPIAVGAKSTYMIGHIFNILFYKWLGVNAAKDLGARTLDWTDTEVIKVLSFIEELNDIGAFPNGSAGLSGDLVLADFQEGRTAFMFTGPWNINAFVNPEKCPEWENIRVAKFPYFEEKPQFKDHDMHVISPHMVSGQLNGREKELTIELAKKLTSIETGSRMFNEASSIFPRSDLIVDENAITPLLQEVMLLGSTSEGMAVDVADFDPIASMMDRVRNSLVGILIGNSPEKAATEIQKEIDENTK